MRKKALAPDHARAARAKARTTRGLTMNMSPDGDPRAAMVQLRLHPHERDALHELARARGMTASAYIRALVNADHNGGVRWDVSADEAKRARNYARAVTSRDHVAPELAHAEAAVSRKRGRK